MTRRAMILLLAGLALVTSAACGSDNKVGDQSLLNFKEQAQTRLGETTTTTAAATSTTVAKGVVTTTTKPAVKSGAAATPTTAKTGSAAPAAAPTAKQAQTIREIDLYADNDPGHDALEPQAQSAFVGSVIRWINKDTVPRAVRADSGQFSSPMIPPGGSWDYTARTAGSFAYSDDTRPYVTGTLVVSKP
jgi:plastocyanin